MYDENDYEHLQYAAEFADFAHYIENIDDEDEFCEFYPTDEYDFDSEMDEVFEDELIGAYV